MAERVTVPDMMNAREARAQAQRTLLARYPGAAVVCLCMNIAGPVKRTENIERAFAWGAAQVKAVLAPYETLFDAAIHEKTGPEAMICVRAEAKAVKKRLCALEDGEELGRLLDIDVIAPDGGKISRTDIGLPARRCLLCDKPAPVCARSRAQTLSGVDSRTVFRRGCSVTSVRIDTEGAARQLGKPRGRYVTLDLSPLQKNADDVLERASRAVGAELRALLGENAKSVLVAGLGNASMTPDAIGPRSAEHVLVTRHLRQNGAFSAFCSVSVLTPGVLGRTGIEAMETLRGTVRAVQPDAVIAIDALASRSLMRLCSTVQLSDTGIVPGSGVGNHRCPLSRDTLGVPVYAIGVPTVVDAATLTLDVLEEAGKSDVDPAALRGHETVMVTTRDIDAQIRELSRIIGYGIDLALQPLDFSELCALMG